ncbi:MAG TPA: cyclic pyranopterin monophosphate synthase MoaC [Dehalococcoidia bacterium]|jgi:cyclic pyranopterin phosphate synthase
MRKSNIRMVDVGGKAVTSRVAVARGSVLMQVKTMGLLEKGKLPKGDVLSAARVAGIMAAKETYRFIPLCHPLLIENVAIDFSLDKKRSAVDITATVKGSGKTGFEMEALTAVAVTGLTIYDMCKTVDQTMRLENMRLIKKSGGKSGAVNFE